MEVAFGVGGLIGKTKPPPYQPSGPLSRDAGRFAALAYSTALQRLRSLNLSTQLSGQELRHLVLQRDNLSKKFLDNLVAL